MTVCIVMGVSGAGKSTIGRKLAQILAVPFVEGDDFHPPSNIQKMTSGQPLTNDDRLDWIKAIAKKIDSISGSSVVACSALNSTVREWLQTYIAEKIQFVVLQGSRDLLLERLNAREGHFFKASMLDSQLENFDPPIEAISVDISMSQDAICQMILAKLEV